jgi:hypothetical protein
MMSRVTCCLVWLAGLLLLDSAKAETLSPDDVIEFLIAGREGIYSGDVTIRGREVRVSHERDSESVVKIQERVMFDERSGVLRQERVIPISPDLRKDGRSNYLHEVSVNGIESSYNKSVEAK